MTNEQTSDLDEFVISKAIFLRAFNQSALIAIFLEALGKS